MCIRDRYTGFDATRASMQFVEQAPWITRFNVQYLLGVDGISMPFILLNSLITVFVVLAGWEVIEEKQEMCIRDRTRSCVWAGRCSCR